MTDLLTLWLGLALLSVAGGCVYVALHGITEEAPVEMRGALWCGRGVLVVAALMLLLACSKVLVLMAAWAIR